MHRRDVLLSLTLLSTGACGDNVGQPSSDPVFELSGDPEGELRLSAAGERVWWQNAIPAGDWESWSTEYDPAEWHQHVSDIDLVIGQERPSWLVADAQFDANHTLEFVGTQWGFGWLAIYPEEGDSRDFDFEALHMAPRDERYDDIQAACEVADTRVLVALSKYEGTLDELLALAEESAAAQGLPAIEDWHQVVKDPEMYRLLFEDHHTESLADTRFAFVTVEMDALCGSLRIPYRTDLVGPVSR